MLTVDALRGYGANVDEGLARCMNNEAFYIKLVTMVTKDTKLSQLEEKLGTNDLDASFELAHALKGMYSNLSLDPLTTPISEMTELLRSRTQTDYTALITEAKAQFEKLCSL